MIDNQFKEKGILAKVLEKGIEILLKKECNKISKVEINIVASSIQIIKGIIKDIHIRAEDINYKDLLFEEVELEANDVKIIFKIKKKEFNIKNNLKIKFKVALSASSLREVLLSKNWNWIGSIISNEILEQCDLEDIKIRHEQIFIKVSKDNKTINKEEEFDIKAKKGKLYFKSKSHDKSIKIPIEDKVFIENVIIQNNLINIFANSTINF